MNSSLDSASRGQMDKDRSVAIVGGCGHIGLPLGIALASQGAQVTLVNTNPDRVRAVLAGRMPFLEEGTDELLPAVLRSGNLTAVSSLERLADHNVVVVTIGTPVDEFLDPSVRVLRQRDRLGAPSHAGRAVAGHAEHRVSGRYRAAGAPGRGAGPQARHRLLPGTHRPRLRAGGAAATAADRKRTDARGALERSIALFRRIAAQTIELRPIEAELAKLFGNAYRYLNFAIANQFYTMAERLGADYRCIHDAIKQDYPRLAGFAPPGFAAGPCLLKDTMQLGRLQPQQLRARAGGYDGQRSDSLRRGPEGEGLLRPQPHDGGDPGDGLQGQQRRSAGFAGL